MYNLIRYLPIFHYSQTVFFLKFFWGIWKSYFFLYIISLSLVLGGVFLPFSPFLSLSPLAHFTHFVVFPFQFSLLNIFSLVLLGISLHTCSSYGKIIPPRIISFAFCNSVFVGNIKLQGKIMIDIRYPVAIFFPGYIQVSTLYSISYVQ